MPVFQLMAIEKSKLNFTTADIDRDAPLRLAVAAALAYPDGSMTASGLRLEASHGRLVIERTAGKDYTTLAAIDRMRVLCRMQQPVRAYGSASGSSKSVDTSAALAAARTIIREQKDRLRQKTNVRTRRP
jgi:hypothetical protein